MSDAEAGERETTPLQAQEEERVKRIFASLKEPTDFRPLAVRLALLCLWVCVTCFEFYNHYSEEHDSAPKALLTVARVFGGASAIFFYASLLTP